MAHNRQSAIRSLRVRNLRSEPGATLTISISSRWSASVHPPLRAETFVVECPGRGDGLELSTESVRLDDQAMALLDEGAPAVVDIVVSDEAGNRVAVEREFLVLARNQWNRDLPALTASFVQPHHPAIPEITRAAGALSKLMGFGNSLDGYQSGPAGAMKNAEVIFSALQSRIPTYINPPASFDEEGQKVRPLDQVLADGQGTCIDLACAYASCLQAAGLNTVIVLVHGHAFPAFFTVNTHEGGELPADVVTDLGTLRALTDMRSGPGGPPVLVPVEGVSITDPEASFAEAAQAARRHLIDRPAICDLCSHLTESGYPVDVEAHLNAAVDVRRNFQRAGIRSLPVRMVEDGVVTVVIDNGPDEVPVVETRDARTNRIMPATVPARVQQWKNSLLDLSLRNRLLNFHPSKQGIALLPPTGSLGAIEDHLVAGRSIEILDDAQISAIHRRIGLDNARSFNDDELARRWRSHAIFGVVDTGTVQARTKRVISAARQDKQENAVNNLNLALGSVTIRGGGSQGKDLVAPIFLVPVVMTWNRGKTSPVITMDEAGTTGVNHCLLEWLRAKQSMKLDWFRADMRDDSGLDILRGLDELRKEIVDLGLSDRIIVNEDAAVALLRFDKIRLWKDLDDHWEQFAASPVVAHLVSGAQGGFTDAADPEASGAPAFDDTTLRNPASADSAQTAAIVRALAGQSFILEGPPGTGKSQTITNLLANALSEGKKVLFVAQKQAALEVVQERLEEAGLDPYCLDLHDKGSSLDSIKTQLRDSLDSDPDLSVLDQWDRLEQEFDATARALDLYRARLHEPNGRGASFAAAHLARLDLADGPQAQLTRSVVSVDPEHLDRVRSAMVDLTSVTAPAKPHPRHPWRFSGATSLASVDRDGLAEVIAVVERDMPVVSAVAGPWAEALQSCRNADDLAAVGSAMSLAAYGGRALPSDEWAAVAQPGWRGHAEAAVVDAVEALGRAAELDSAWGQPSVLAQDASAHLADVRLAAGSFIIGRKKRVRLALGLSGFKVDLAVTLPGHEDRWLGAVLLDGAAWGRRELALDRDALPLTVLKGMLGWPVVARVWLPSWRLERDAVVSAIHDLVDKAAMQPPVGLDDDPHSGEGEHPTEITGRRPLKIEPPTRRRPYRAWNAPSNLGTPDDIAHSGLRIGRLLTEAANIEGPVLLDDALRSIARGFRLQVVRENRLAEIRRYAPRSVTVRTPFGVWLYPAEYVRGSGDVSAEFDWYRPEGRGKIQQVAPHEIANAMVDVARSAHSISKAELVRETLRVFGYARCGAEAVAHTEAVAEWAVQRGLLTGHDGDLRAA